MTVSLIMFGLIGILIGVLSSMFGFGGGFVVVPVLYAFLPDTIPHEYLMHTAIGSSLAVMIINSFNSTYNHSRKGNIKWAVFKKLAGFIAAGSLIGGIVAIFIDSEVLSDPLHRPARLYPDQQSREEDVHLGPGGG